MREIVDVFAGASKVDEFCYSLQFRQRTNAVFEEILNGFYVVIRGALGVFNPFGIGERKLSH